MTKLTIFACLISFSLASVEAKGIITSENYPDNYPNDFNRNYTINSDEDSIVITFSDFELEENSDCSWDWLMIIDGDGSTLLPKTCGADKPGSVRSNTNTAVIIFHSDRSETFRGFNVTWESRQSDSTCDPCSKCNNEQSKCEASSGCIYDVSSEVCLPPENGIITSENYPDNYPKNFNRNYTINARDTIVITFLDFELEEKSDCSWDWVMILDGDGSTLLPKTCGADIPAPIWSHTNTAVIVFHSDRSQTFRGFNITWESRQSDCVCGEANRNENSRIAAGSETEVNEYPWMVHLTTRYMFWSITCGGSLISDRWVLTAAHCVENNPIGVRVDLGQHNLNTEPMMRTAVSSVTLHPDYEKSPKTVENDIALLELEDPIDFNTVPNIKPICLPSLSLRDESFVGSKATVAGWGRTNPRPGSGSSVLLDAEVTVISNTECQERRPQNTITDSMLCNVGDLDKENHGACRGDSGGPLMTRVGSNTFYTLIGAVSWGSPERPCTYQEGPGVFARVTTFLDWIEETTRGSNHCAAGTN